MYIFIYLLFAILLHFDNKIYLQKKNEVNCSFFNYMVTKGKKVLKSAWLGLRIHEWV